VVRRLLGEQPSLAAARFRRRGGTLTPLHLTADWPGYFPHAPEIVRLLLAAGAEVDARTEGGSSGETSPPGETPLHWAASSDDLDVADALIDGGADIEAPDGSIGTPLANAVGYGCWHVARRLVERGARVSALWQAAALGLRPRVAEFLAADPAPSKDELNAAFWQACHGGQRRVAEELLRHGADLRAVPDYAKQPAVEISGGPDTRRELLVTWLRERDARPG
jgi:ankyrin repeat protein